MLFDGINDFGVVGSSASQFNFMHSQTALLTLAFWYKQTNAPAGLETIFTSRDGAIGFFCFANAAGGFNIGTDNGGANPVFISNSSYIPDTNWHFYTITYDQSLANTNLVLKRDDANTVSANKTADVPSNSNGVVANVARRGGSNDRFLDGSLAELSVWNRILSAQEQTILSQGIPIY